MKKVSFTFLLFVVSLFSSLQAQDFNQQADAYLQRYYELMRFNGRVLVANDQAILYNKAWGMADHEQGKPLSESSLFNIAGLSEQFAAYIAVQLINQQKLSLQKPVKAYIRDVNWGTKANITLHHLLTHTSGLPDYPLIHELPEKQFSSVADMKAYLSKLELQHEPGTSFGYSKLNYNLVGLILESATGKTYQQLVEEWISQPLKMQNTFVESSAQNPESLVKGHVVMSYTKGWQAAAAVDPINHFAAQGIISSPEDLLVWHRYVKERLVRNPAYRLLFTPYLNNIGWGYQVVEGPNGKVKQLNSLDGVYNSGFNAWSGIDNESDLIVIVLSNNRHPVSGEIGAGLRNIFQKKAFEMPLAREVVKIDPALLEEYAGSYTINEQFTIKVLKENNRLFIDDGMHPKFEVYPQSATHFFMKDRDAGLSFVRNKEGKVTQMVLYDGFMEGMPVNKTK